MIIACRNLATTNATGTEMNVKNPTMKLREYYNELK